MTDPDDPPDAPPPAPPTPPPGFAGGPPVPTAPPGFTGAGAGSGPPLGQVPVPPARPTATSRPSSKGRGPGRAIAVAVVLLLIAGGGFVLLRPGQDDDAGSTTTTTSSAAPGPTVPSEAKLTPDGPGEAFQAFAGAIAAGDTERACDLLTEETVAKIEQDGRECATALAAGDASPFPKGAAVVVLGESIDGDRAEVSSKVGERIATKPAVLVREDGTWRIALFARSTGMGNVAGAQTAACQTEQRTVETAVAAYFAQEGEYPADVEALVGTFLTQPPPNSTVSPDGTVTMINDCA